jgi:hypothetical protein
LASIRGTVVVFGDVIEGRGSKEAGGDGGALSDRGWDSSEDEGDWGSEEFFARSATGLDGPEISAEGLGDSFIPRKSSCINFFRLSAGGGGGGSELVGAVAESVTLLAVALVGGDDCLEGPRGGRRRPITGLSPRMSLRISSAMSSLSSLSLEN